ncbi:hypothetical protein EX011_21845 [Salmonella enterica]|nr:hypothetical protein [Salmonella enterica]EAW2493053.1 hypothetical protein [Salmonella enterica subsp. enterica]HAV7961548.1 hypothetical protein [Escherichia coli]EBL7042168.1 hypothetical protein [Salmonella enterica]EHQ9605885.1 hypothetical protein [Salmonella enterica]
MASDKTKGKRVSLDLSEEAFARLNKIKNQLDATSNTETVVRALRVMEYVVEARKQGRKLQFVSFNGRITDLEILG